MDLHTLSTYLRPQTLDQVKDWQPDWAWLAGGTWMFGEPQPQIKTLVDLQGLGWSELEATEAGLTIGATCVMSRLLKFDYPSHWTAVHALQRAVQELASFKIQNVATIAGNLCLALPAGTFAPVMLVLGARYEIFPVRGEASWVEAIAFQTGAKRTLLKPGEVLRRIVVPPDYLHWQVNYQRICVATAGLALAIVVTAVHPTTRQVRIGIGAATPAPHLLVFDHEPSSAEIAAALDTQLTDWIEDDQASAAYRRQVTQVLVERSLFP